METRLRDIIEVPYCSPFTKLSDTEADPEGITSTFLFTDDVSRSMRSILASLCKERGEGIFIKGGYGAGKSTFLSYLLLLLKHRSLDPIEDFPKLVDTETRVVQFSLFDYDKDKTLQDIVLWEADYSGAVMNRSSLFQEIFPSRTVLIADELSDFLAAKFNPGNMAPFMEDIRFLGFLGEYARDHPFWPIFALQEFIEDKWQIVSDEMNRIKDRYLVRETLTAGHIEELIDRKIIKKKEGADEFIKAVFSKTREYYPRMKLSYDAFRRTFPLHPLTVDYLAGITSVFSRHRGVIQFVQDAAGRILDEPADTLITPEVLFDHFEERIRETSDYTKLATVVYDYYKNHVREIFPRERMQETALAAIKILILTEISPQEKKKKAADIAELLLRRIARDAGDRNYEFVEEAVLKPLVAHGMFILRDGAGAYYIDPKVDEALRIKTRIKNETIKLAQRELLFDYICKLTTSRDIPLKEIKLFGNKDLRFTWQNSDRMCRVSVADSAVKKPGLQAMLSTIERFADCWLTIMSPFCSDRVFPYGLNEMSTSHYLPLIAFWLPREPHLDEITALERYVAKSLLLEEFPDLKPEFEQEGMAFARTMGLLYKDGKIVTASGTEFTNIPGMAAAPLELVLPGIFDHALSQVHPRHIEVMPRTASVTFGELSTLYGSLIRPGKVSVEEAKKKGLTKAIENLLIPMGIVEKNKKGDTYQNHIEASNELVSHILKLASHEEILANIVLTLRKGKWGLSGDQIYAMLSMLISSGQLAGYGIDGEPVDLHEIAQLYAKGSPNQIVKLRAGKPLSPDLLGYIHHGKFIWGDVETVPTPLTQRAMWKSAGEFITRGRKIVSEINRLSNLYRERTAFKKLSINQKLINRHGMFVESMHLKAAPEEGLEKFLMYLRENPDMAAESEYIDRLHSLFTRDFEDLARSYLTLLDPTLKMPPDNQFEGIALKEQREILLARIEDFLATLKGDFNSISEQYHEFYNSFTAAYIEGHHKYYQSEIFQIKSDIENWGEARVLKAISHISTENFPGEWWELNRELEKIPRLCSANLDNELSARPSCKCGYLLGATPPGPPADFRALTQDGIMHFIRLLQSPSNKERLDTYAYSITSVHPDAAKKISKIITLNLDKTSPTMVLPLLTDDVLNELGNALRGNWKLRDVKISEFVEAVKGKRFKRDEISSIFFNWIGDDQDVVIHVRDISETEVLLVKEQLAKYGEQGTRVWAEVDREIQNGSLFVQDLMSTKEAVPIFDSIKLGLFSTDQLLKMLAQEKITALRRRIRGEIYDRSHGNLNPPIDIIEDSQMRDLLQMSRVLSECPRYSGVDIFTKALAPATLLLEKLLYENAENSGIEDHLLAEIKSRVYTIADTFDADPNKLAGAFDLASLKDTLNGAVFIFDGLRFDLWTMLRTLIEAEGWNVKEMPYLVPSPTSTHNFRQVVGLGDDTKGSIGDKSYVLMKWAERDASRRELKKLLKRSETIRFISTNFIDSKMHNSTLDLYPLYLNIKAEFITGILPMTQELTSFSIVSDHGFFDTRRFHDRYIHGNDSVWEKVVPYAQVSR